MKLLVGLWNPWKQYEKTRHNVGFFVVDNFLKDENIKDEKWNKGQGKWNGELQESIIDGQKIFFLKPMTFMNRSWSAVSAVANFYKIKTKDILVIHDDIDLPVGKIQLKLWWSSAGHNWLKDILSVLWTKDFWRLRIGVDRPIHQEYVADYVLSNFKKEEKESIESKRDEIKKHISEFIDME